MVNKRKILKVLLRSQTLFAIFLYIRELPLKVKGGFEFRKDKNSYTKLNNTNFVIKHTDIYPCLTDRYKKAGGEGAYFWQDLWCARLVAANNPMEHYDIGSRIDGFIAHLASFRGNIHLIDIRPYDMEIPGVDFKQEDATNLGGVLDNSVESISALCSLEHFGLGRYGDPIDPNAYLKAMKSIERVLMPGGHAYISVPIGQEHLEFNAHRIFKASTIVNIFGNLELIEFSTTDGKNIEKNTPIHKYDEERDNMGGRFGLFHFRKQR